VHFSFFTFFIDFVIFQVVKWMFLIFPDFQISCDIPCPTVDISKFSNFFSFPCHISCVKCVFLIFSRHIPGPTVCISHFSCFSLISSFLVVKWMFLIFPDFQVSRHIPGPTVCIYHFSRFSLILHFSRRQVDVSHFP